MTPSNPNPNRQRSQSITDFSGLFHSASHYRADLVSRTTTNSSLNLSDNSDFESESGYLSRLITTGSPNAVDSTIENSTSGAIISDLPSADDDAIINPGSMEEVIVQNTAEFVAENEETEVGIELDKLFENMTMTFSPISVAVNRTPSLSVIASRPVTRVSDVYSTAAIPLDSPSLVLLPKTLPNRHASFFEPAPIPYENDKKRKYEEISGEKNYEYDSRQDTPTFLRPVF